MPHSHPTIRIRYQPIIRLTDEVVDSVEILVRAATEDGGVTGPESIVAGMTSAVESLRLTQEIIQCAHCEHAAHDLATLKLGFAFNLPLDAMLHPGLVAMLDATLRGTSLSLDRISLELTERYPVDDIAGLKAAIGALKTAGYGVALDDLMPDTPHLDALLALPVDTVKLDQSVAAAADGHGAFIRQIVKRATQNGQAIIAEGIETLPALAALRHLGVTHGQGFLFARPLPATELPSFLAAWAERETPQRISPYG